MALYLKNFNNDNEYTMYLKSDDYIVPNVSTTNESIYYGTTYAITVVYLYPNGNKVRDDVVVHKEPGESYSIQSPTIQGFVPSHQVISGVTAKNANFTVTYTPESIIIPDDDLDPIIE